MKTMNQYIVSIWTETCGTSYLAEFPTRDSARLFAMTIEAHLGSLWVVYNEDNLAPQWRLTVTDLRTSKIVWEFPQWCLGRSEKIPIDSAE